MKSKLKKIANIAVVSVMLLGVSLSNIPYWAISDVINAYIQTRDIVDKAWFAQQYENGVVDRFSTLKEFSNKFKVYEAMAAISYNSNGAFAYSASGGTSVAPAYPASIAANDLLVLIIGMKPSVDNGGSVTTPSGWTPMASLINAGGYGAVVPGADTGDINIFSFYKVAAGTETGNLTVTIASNNVSWAQIYRLSNASGSWSVVGTTGQDTTAGNVSIAMSADPGVTGGDYIIGAMSIPTNVTTPAQFSAEAFSQSGMTFGAVTEVGEADSGNGNDIGGFVARAAVSSGTSAGVPTITATAGGTTTNVRGPGVFIRVRETNTAPTLTVSQPDGTADTVTVGDPYNITYDLADPDPKHAVTAAMYYDTDATGLNGTAISGACATAAEGTGATCSWDTTGMTPGTYYVYGITNDGIAAQVNDYSPGVITINAPASTLTISQTAGSKIATKNSGDVDQYAHDTACTGAASCAAFTLAASGGTVNVSSIRVTEGGTVTANTELSDVNLYYDTDGNWSDAGAETLFGTAATLAADQTATISGALAITAGQTAYIYVRYDLANSATYPIGGATANWQIAASGDVVSDGTESGSGTLAGTQTVLPVADSVTYAVGGDGGRSGDTATISGKGFGAPSIDADQQDCSTATVGSKGCVRFIVGGNATMAGSDISTWNNTTVTFAVNTSIATFGGASALEVVAAAQSTATDRTYYIYPNITSVTVPGGNPADSARETESITLNGNHFDTNANQGTVTFQGGFNPSQSASVSSWSDTAVTVTVPAGIDNNDYTGDILLTRAAATGSKTELAYGANTFRVLPTIASTGPVNVKGGRGDTGVSIAGDHLCQSGSCPTAFSSTDKVSFTGGEVTSGASIWTDTSIPSITIPGTATDGNLNITSNTSFTSNNLTYDIKFAPSTPTGSSGGGTNNPALSGSAFSDGTDGDTHTDTQWQIAHNADADWTTPEWTRTSGSAEIGTTVNSSNGTFANGDSGQTALDCGTTYKGRVRHKDNAGVASQEWSSWSADYTFSTGSCGPNATSMSNSTEGGLTDGARLSQTVVISGSAFGTVSAGNRATCGGGAGTGCVKVGGTGGYTLADGDITAWSDTSITFALPSGVTGYGGATTNGSIVYAASASDSDGLTFYVYPDVTALTAPLGSNDGAREYDAADTDGIITITGNKFGTGPTGGSVVIVGGTVATYVADGTCDAADGWADTCIKVRVPTTIADGTDSGYVIVTQGTGTNNKASNATDAQGAINIWPRVTSIGAASFADGGFQDGTFTLNGSHFGASAGSISVNGQTQDGTPTWGASSVTNIGIPNTGTDSGSITLTHSSSRTSNSSSTFYVYPQITGFTAAQTDGDVQSGIITISGNHLGAAGAASNISINGVIPSSIGAWSATSIPTVDIPNSGSDSGVITITRASDSKASNNSSAFYIYPQITSLTVPTAVADAAREYDAGDSDGVITASGNHFGAAGSVTVIGSTATQQTTGTCTGSAYQATCVGLQIPTSIADGTYTGNIVLTRTAGSKTHTYAGFRVLGRIASLTPASGVIGADVTIAGDHLCGQTSCPAAATWNASTNDGNDVKWDTNNVTVLSSPGEPTHTTIYADTPNITEGIYTVTVTGNSYVTNGKSFTINTSKPNTPTNTYQFKTNTDTAQPPTTNTAVGSGMNQTNAWFRMDMSGPLTGESYYPQVEVKPIGTAFECTNASPSPCSVTSGVYAEGAGVTYNGTAVQGFVQATGLTNGTSYHWQARVRNSAGTGNWASFGGNAESAADFYVDTTAPTIGSCPFHSSVTASGATVAWSPSDNVSTTFTKQVQYATTTDFLSSVCTNGTCGSSTSGYGANPQSVTLSGLSPNTVYYYRVRSKDGAESETTAGYGLSGDTSCTFTTSKANMKTVEYFITGETGAISAEVSRNFSAYVADVGYSIQSAFVEVSGNAAAVAGPLTLQLKVVGGASPQSYTSYTIPTSASAPTPFTVIHQVPISSLYISPTDSTQNQLYLNPTVSVNIASAKIVLTYYYTPQ